MGKRGDKPRGHLRTGIEEVEGGRVGGRKGGREGEREGGREGGEGGRVGREGREGGMEREERDEGNVFCWMPKMIRGLQTVGLLQITVH